MGMIGGVAGNAAETVRYEPPYRPEGMLIGTAANREAISSLSSLERAMASGRILEGMAVLCDSELNLRVELGGGMRGVIPRAEAAYTSDGSDVRDIAIITRVGKAVSFCVMAIERDTDGTVCAVLSRRAAQRQCVRNYLSALIPGDIIPARVTHLEHFGAFVDIGCGVVSLLSIDCISVSRISHPRDRFYVGMHIRAAVRSIERSDEGEMRRIYVTHRELLGTWEENAVDFSVGQTVAGTVRSVEDYGVFVELTPNLAGLAECREGVSVGQTAAVYIKNILPERMKIKLVLIDAYSSETNPRHMRYFIPEQTEHIALWRYSPPGCRRIIETDFNSEIPALP